MRSHSKVAVFFLFASLIVLSCSKQTQQESKTGTLTEITLNATTRSSTINGVRISSNKSEGAILTQIEFNGKIIHLEFERDVVFYISSVDPSQLLVHDLFASDEDRLILCDLRGGKQKLVEHTDLEDYLHRHFTIISSKNFKVELIEEEYAGSLSPRERNIEINLNADEPDIQTGSWIRIQ